MDFLLIIYSILLILIILFPAIFLTYKYQSQDESSSPFGSGPREDISNLMEEKEILLSNLGDLKAEEETGKMKQGEFREYSKELLVALNDVDQKILTLEKSSPSANSPLVQNEISSANKQTENKTQIVVKFCPACGTKALENAKFCHNCGTKF
ncbi:MAG: zinc ribbon domain-containing protein [Leptospira sp.]|nr:zinc ribbon domain-containing protein [Leptospira sp.]